MIENLKDHCLPADGARKGTAKMHDVVRDVAIWIATNLENRCKSLIHSGAGLFEISEIELVESLKRVSFMNNKIKKLPDCEIRISRDLYFPTTRQFSLDIVPGNSYKDFHHSGP